MIKNKVINPIVVLALFSLFACMSPSAPKLDHIDDSDLLRSLNTEIKGVTMAVGDTVTIPVTIYNILGEVFDTSDKPPIVWESLDPTLVGVTPEGKVYGIAPTPEGFISVVASWTYRGVTVAGSAQIAVTEERHPVTRLKIVPVDSTQVGLGGRVSLYIQALTSDGDSVDGAHAFLSHSADYGVRLGDGNVRYDGTKERTISSSTWVGTYWVYATSLVYGTLMKDSLLYHGLYPAISNSSVSVYRHTFTDEITTNMAGSNFVIQRYGRVSFYRGGGATRSTDIFDVIFDDPSGVVGCPEGQPGGDIVALRSTMYRCFANVGIVRWTIRDGATGEVFPELTGTITVVEP